MLKDRQLILAKIEAVYGTDSVPTPAANAILADKNIEFSVIGKKLSRAHALAWMGQHPPLNIGEGLVIKFNTEIRGKGGLPDVPPEVGPLFRAANHTETITPATKVAYALNSKAGIPEGAESVSIYYYEDRIWHKLLGARGNMSVFLKSGEFGVMTWEFTGIYAGPVHVAAIPEGEPDETVPPRFVSAGFSVDGFPAIIESLKLDLGNKIVKRSSANAATGILEWMITDRVPKGNVDPEVPDMVAASLSTDLAGLNNDLVFTAVEKGIEGTDISIKYEDGGVAGAEVVTVTDTAIVVTLQAGVSTATQVRTAYNAKAEAIALATCALKGGNDGTGTVPIMAETHLANGAGKDFWKMWEESRKVAIAATVGQTAGNKCVITCASAVLDVPGYGDREGILTHGLPSTLHPGDAGNDEWLWEYQ